MIKKPTTNYIVQFFPFVILCILPWKGNCQSSGDTVADALIEMGFENVSWIEDEEERIFAFECASYTLPSIGIRKAVDKIRETGLLQNKDCKLIILNNNIPQILLNCQPSEVEDSLSVARNDWSISYEMGKSWKKLEGAPKKNSSLFKVDIVIYPELSFQNYKLSRIYDVVFNLSPSIEISLWKGMKLATQVIFPIVNDNYGERYDQIRPGFVTLSQTFRLPQRTFLTATVGTFNNFRWGIDIEAKHFLKDERFSLEARVGYTGSGYYDNWSYNYGKIWRLTGSIGGNFYWPKYNTLFSLKGERYLLKEYGIRGEMIRHFRYASIGFYGMLVEHAGNDGFNGGFLFQISIPPYKNKRKGYIPRVSSGDFALRYNAGNEEIYGKGYRARANKNDMRDNSFNPYFIKSELLNF